MMRADEKLVKFLYCLITDELPIKTVARVVQQASASGDYIATVPIGEHAEACARGLARMLQPEIETKSKSQSLPRLKTVESEGHCWPVYGEGLEPRESEHCIYCHESYSSGASLPGHPCQGEQGRMPRRR